MSAKDIKDLSIAAEYLSRIRYVDSYISRIEQLIDSKLKEMENEQTQSAPYETPPARAQTQDDEIPF